MSPCRRFEQEALERIERGLPLDPHFERCPDCRAAADVYRQLQDDLKQLPKQEAPAEGWQDRVWQAIDREKERVVFQRARGVDVDDTPIAPDKPGWRRYALLAAAAVVVVFLASNPEIVRRLIPMSESIETGVVPQPGATLRAEDEAGLGDLLSIVSRIGNRKYYELRIYRHDRELVLQCSDRPPCVRTWPAGLEASVRLDTIGTYQPMLLVSDQPIPTPAPDLDDDARRATETGAEVKLGKQVRVH